jgi:hypothetical protein
MANKDTITTKADQVLDKVADETVQLVTSARDDAKNFLDNHLPALEAKGVAFASSLGSHFSNLLAEAEKFLAIHAK